VLVTVLIALGLPLAAAATPRAGAPRQTDPATTVTTTENLLEGETTTASTAPATTAVPRQSVADAQKQADADTRRVWTIVIALLVVAFLFFVLTIAYWRHTRPSRQPAPTTPAPKHAKGAGKAEPKPEPPAEPDGDGEGPKLSRKERRQAKRAQ